MSNKMASINFDPIQIINDFCDDNVGVKAYSKDVETPEGTFKCYVNSERYLLFKRDGLSCSSCGKTATVAKLMLPLPKSSDPDRAHFNFYCQEGDRLILFTKDHKISKANGGKNVMKNYIPMCQDCNTLKGAKCNGNLEDAIKDGSAAPIDTTFVVRVPLNVARSPEYMAVLNSLVSAVGGIAYHNLDGDPKMYRITLPQPALVKHFKNSFSKLVTILVEGQEYARRVTSEEL